MNQMKKGDGGGVDDSFEQDVMLTSQAPVSTNHKCPITAKLIDDIDEPVKDQKAETPTTHIRST